MLMILATLVITGGGGKHPTAAWTSDIERAIHPVQARLLARLEPSEQESDKDVQQRQRRREHCVRP